MKQNPVPNVATPRYAFTREEAAKILGLGVTSIDRLTKRGLLRPSRALRRPLYSSEELQRFCRETTGEIETVGVVVPLHAAQPHLGLSNGHISPEQQQ